MAQLDDAITRSQTLAFIFEISAWNGILQPDDPDGHILDVAFFSREEAIERLKQLKWKVMYEPVIAYLRRETTPGSVWFYRLEEEGKEECIMRLPGSIQSDTPHQSDPSGPTA